VIASLNLGVGAANKVLSPVAPRIGDNAKLAVAQGYRTGAIGSELEADRVQGELQFRRGAHKDSVHWLVESLVREPNLKDFSLLQRKR